LNYLFGIYIRAFPVTTISGAAGAIIVLLLWLFVMDQFILFGAQFSNVYAETVGSHAKIERSDESKSKEEEGLMKRARKIWKLLIESLFPKVSAR
jgi:membrane protein